MKRLLYPNTGVGIKEKSRVYGFEKKKEQGEPLEPANHRQKWKFPETASSTSTFYLIIIIIAALREPPTIGPVPVLIAPHLPSEGDWGGSCHDPGSERAGQRPLYSAL